MRHDTTSRRRVGPAALLTAIATAAFALMLVFAGAAPANAAGSPTPSPSSSAAQSIQIWIRKAADRSNVPGVKVTVSQGSFSQTVTSGDDGKALVPVPTPGTYKVELDASTVPEGAGTVPTGLNPRQVVVSEGNQGVPAYYILVAQGGASPTPGATGGASSGASDGASGGGSGASLFELVLPRIVTGLIFGLLLALASIGVSLIYGTTGLNNFAHGELVTFGALMGYVFSAVLGLPGFVAIIAATVLGGVFGYVQDLGLWRPLRRRGVALVPLMIVSIGLSLALRYLFQFIFGADQLVLPADNRAALVLGPIRLRSTDIISAVICIVLLLLVAFVLLRTRIGKATRAVSDNRSLAAASGIDVERVIRTVWVGAGALAGLAGVLIGYYQSLRWDTGASILLLIFAAVTLGGFGTAFGALVGSLVIGVITDVSTVFIPNNLKYVAALVVLIAILLVRPQGILGRRSRIG
ncbi:branched-chain amino acid ABC transporter permease [Amnibacterium kyonggiense]|uniref:Amino acid/amide ABC transporter membrane protein 1 (HAAT family) n=1 Tax=Amnibacterium kyonggiense TaxID=595671 RepID=A0A4R7FQV9_9MICO|nr:branched-chain amino acid ABC transporter permease [Amnibacterium kyonggiense]TDS80182.1 amino acid/amide ABC transporter membrane protein 1 (HAAT family) [Amnibacterium kyonggiense]